MGCLKKCKMADLKVCIFNRRISYIHSACTFLFLSCIFCFSFSKTYASVLQALPKGKWFCSVNCKWMYSALQNLLNAGAEKIPDSSLDIMKKKLVENGLAADIHFDVRWRLLNGKVTSRENRILLSQAVAIFHVRIV